MSDADRVAEASSVAVRKLSRLPLLGLAAVAAVLSLRYCVAGNGSLLVSVAARGGLPLEDVQVFVDSKPFACARLPCAVFDRAPGTHEVYVAAPGFVASKHERVAVGVRVPAMVSFVIEPLPSVGLKVGGAQPGIVLWVDGREVGELPQEVHGLALGSHQLLLAGGDAYQSLSRSVELQPGKLTDVGIIKLRVLKAQLHLLPGNVLASQVWLRHGAEVQQVPALPATVTVSADDHWSLAASRPGYVDYLQTIDFDDGEREKTFTVELLPVSRALGPVELDAGELSSERVRETALRYMPSVNRACWSAAFATRAAAAPLSARLTAVIQIAANGRVLRAVTGKDPKGFTGLSDCVARRVRGWQFPPARVATTTNVPFVFGMP